MVIKKYKNKGMYIEDLLNKTCEYYLNNDIAFFTKRFLPIQIISRKENRINGILLKKSTVDYNGIYKGVFVDFESKETNNDYFNLSSIPNHQEDHIFLINKFNGISFFIIGFIHEEDHFFIITCNDLLILKSNNKKRINIDYCNNNFYKIKIIFPGILDIISFIDNELMNDI